MVGQDSLPGDFDPGDGSTGQLQNRHRSLVVLGVVSVCSRCLDLDDRVPSGILCRQVRGAMSGLWCQ
jgi:hypothetical protein